MAIIREKINSQGCRNWWFWCPGCQDLHMVRDDIWDFSGTLENPTIRASIFVHGAQHGRHDCHSFVTNGQIEFLNDCTHELAGKAVSLPQIPLDDTYW